ncbi:MAG: type II toxin-antitoxin system VapC family toxin [Anaerolineae bacterium]|nr:type II toxin-antitoxin system VapC family toxin [Anaerolineae bacterium]
MKFLLDTHSFIWFVEGNPALSENARQLIEEPTNEAFLSLASVWEMAIKVSLGKLHLSQPFDLFIPNQVLLNDITLLDITVSHTLLVATLPFHHRDPFDRLLIAQSLVESWSIISADSVFDAYGVNRLW